MDKTMYRKELLEQLETAELIAILNEMIAKVAVAGDMLQQAKETYHNSETQQQAAAADRYIKNCRQHLTDCRKFRTLIQTIIIDRGGMDSERE
jgi:hypothetical protein